MRILALASAAVLFGLLSATAAEHPPLPSAAEIVEKAIERSKWQREQGLETDLRFRYLSRQTKLDSAGQPSSTEERLYRVYPLDGALYHELIQIDGEPLDGGEREKEAKRRREFLEKRAKAAAGEPVDDEDDPRRFDRDLIERYEADVEGIEQIDGRPSYVLRFQPKSGDLPVHKRIDHVLNNSSGRLWIDSEEYGIARIEFDLLQPVKFWAGLIGVVRDMDGWIDFTRLEGGIWHPQRMEMQMEGRVLWNSLDRKIVLDWHDFEVPDEIARATPPAP